MHTLFISVIGALAMVMLTVIGTGLVFAQAASPRGTEATPAAQPTAKPLKNPTAPHHHYDRRRPHRGAHSTPTPD